MFCYFPVPPPQVNVRANQTYLLYAGDSLMLTCTVTINPNVDSNERVTTSWNGIDGERHRVTTTSVMGNIYTRSLIISPLALQDVGWYTCIGTITGDNGLDITGSDNHYIATIRN